MQVPVAQDATALDADAAADEIHATVALIAIGADRGVLEDLDSLHWLKG